MFHARPVKCNICGSPVVFGQMKDFNVTSFQSGYGYFCTNPKCGASVGTHKKKHKDALGTLADAETRQLRALCHEEFNRHWYTLTTREKSRIYYKLSKALHIRYEDCHFGYMQAAELKKALSIMKSWD